MQQKPNFGFEAGKIIDNPRRRKKLAARVHERIAIGNYSFRITLRLTNRNHANELIKIMN